MIIRLKQKLGSLEETVVRFPVTVAFLAAAAALTAASIARSDNLSKLILSSAVGAVASAAGQAAFERFFKGGFWRGALAAAALAVTFLFYLSVRTLADNGRELPIRSAVSLFALFVAFIWLGVVRSRYGFDESFTAAFKALFQSAFFSGILFLGVAAIIAAVDRLITPVDSDAYAYTADIVFIMIAPLIVLSLLPAYPGKTLLKGGAEEDGKQTARIEKRIGSPKFLEVLLSWIVIPLAAVFTVILLVYIALNIGGRFWTNNLLEPMLISYSVTVIVVTLLVSRYENRPAMLFRTIFPKVLVPVALFQVAASLLTLRDAGVTYGRYFVIMYGVFAVFSGVALSLLPARKSGAVALALLILSAVALIPPLDAFTLSRNSQIAAMEAVLSSNGMLSGNTVKPKETIPDAGRSRISGAVRYLADMGELGRVAWLPSGFNGYDDTQFYRVFGFHMVEQAQPQYPYISVYYAPSALIPINGYDAYSEVILPAPDKLGGTGPNALDIGGRSYRLAVSGVPGAYAVAFRDSSGNELVRFDMNRVFERYAGFPPSKSAMTQEEATFTEETATAVMKVIVRSASFNTAPGSSDQNVQMLVFIRIK
jgi:hypothetical protein